MAEKFKPIFERTLAEQAELIQTQIIRVQEENLACGLYNSFLDSRLPKDTFIRQYRSHKEIVRIDAATGQAEIIDTLH